MRLRGFRVFGRYIFFVRFIPGWFGFLARIALHRTPQTVGPKSAERVLPFGLGFSVEKPS